MIFSSDGPKPVKPSCGCRRQIILIFTGSLFLFASCTSFPDTPAATEPPPEISASPEAAAPPSEIADSSKPNDSPSEIVDPIVATSDASDSGTVAASEIPRPSAPPDSPPEVAHPPDTESLAPETIRPVDPTLESTATIKPLPVNPLLTEDRPVKPSSATDPSPAPDLPRSPMPAPAPILAPTPESAPSPSLTPVSPPSAAPVVPGAPPPQPPVDPAPDPAISTPATPPSIRPPIVIPSDPVVDPPPVDPRLSAATPERLLSGPGEITVTLDGRGWVFRSDLSSKGPWQFLSRERNGDSTQFKFRFPESGRWNMVFDRQDLSSGGTERVTRDLRVGKEADFIDSGLSQDGSSSDAVSGDMPADADERHRAAADAVAEGRYDDAIVLWEQDAPDNNKAGRRARSSIMETAAQTASVVPLSSWLTRYLDDDPDTDTLAAALNVFENQMGYKAQIHDILKALVERDFGERRPEWLYKMARILEEPGPRRNLDTARVLYEQVMNRWPLSSWSYLSEERLNWLQRHYFRVR